MNRHDADITAPTQYDILSYIMYLSDSLASPGAALNYLSGARTWVRMVNGATNGFDSYSVALMKRGIQRNSAHRVIQAPPLAPADIKNVVIFMRSAGPNGLVLTAAILIGYFTLIRQSNLLVPDNVNSDSHVVRTKDITATSTEIIIKLRSTKTRWKSGPPLHIAVPAIRGSPYCPATAWLKYIARLHPPRNGPAFIDVNGLPLKPRALLGTMRLALAVAGHPRAQAFTLHSLRRGGAQACAQMGASLSDIQELGTWKSHAVHTYVPRDLVRSAPRSLSYHFG